MRKIPIQRSSSAVLLVVGMALMTLGFAAPVTAASVTCSATNITGNFVSPFGPFSGSFWMQTFGPSPLVNPLVGSQKGGIIQGTFAGDFTSSGVPSAVNGPVMGAWSLNPATGKLLMKVVGATFYIDYAFLNLPPAGFTFQGSLHVVGQQPVPMVETAMTGITFPPVIPISCA